MIKSILASFFLSMMAFSPVAFSDDVLMYEDFYNYNTGYYDSKAVLYDTDNDWYYDYYVVGPQEEVEYEYDALEGEYEWEVKEDLF